MATKLWAAMLVLFTTLLTSSAQILWKKGVATLSIVEPLAILANYYIIGGILLYVVGGILIIMAFRGGEVSVLYPIIATSYIWVSWLSVFFLNERMNIFKWFGVALIMFGIILIGYGSKDHLPGAI
ncbi:EamA family transporter [Candidatus Woesearchaeota archaeon]|nr:EamA family transporter [Candidatus Woesearchaeota archaeon]